MRALLIRALRALCLALVRFFYKEMKVEGTIPAGGRVITVANHPNGLVDPVVLGLALNKPMHFLAKSTLFKSALGRAATEAFFAIPVYRAKEADTKQNDETFRRCHQILQRDAWLALFPEGVSHSDTQLQPLKTGAARIALSAEAASDFALGVTLLPVGLTYEDKETFRSAVTVSIGAPMTITHYKAQYEADPVAAAKALTDELTVRLRAVVLEASDAVMWRGFRMAAHWIINNGGARGVATEEEALARALARRHAELMQSDPARAIALVDRVRAFDRLLDSVDVEEPFEVDVKVSSARLLRTALGLSLAAPFALVGALFGYVPYSVVDPLARRLAGKETDLIGTIKALLGMVILAVAYMVEAVAIGSLVHPLAGLATLFAAPLSGYVALRFAEKVRRRSRLLRSYFKRVSKAHVLAALAVERQQLATAVFSELEPETLANQTFASQAIENHSKL